MRIICVGAHPDDCEIGFGGTAAKLAAQGHAVKFVSVTNGDAGHAVHSGEALAEIRRGEAEEAARRLGIAATEVLPFHDGELVPNVEARQEIVRRIRSWQADVVLTHRPYDYHPDHRYTSQIVQDSAYLVMVPNVCRETPPLARNPVYLYLEDAFERPIPFEADVVTAVDDAWEQKIAALDAHASQFYEWLPWVDGRLDDVPACACERTRWLSQWMSRPLSANVRSALTLRYGPGPAREIQHAEAFQLCEYGRQPDSAELEQMFPR